DYFQNTVPISVARIMTTTDGAAPVGEEREFTDWVQTGSTGTITPVWTVAPAAGDTYVIFKEYSWAETVQAINSAIDIVASRALIEKIDETITVRDATYEYPVPTGFTHIYRISMANGSGVYQETIPGNQYKIIRGMGIPRIHFYRFPARQAYQDHYYSALWADSDLVEGRYLRIEGLGRQPRLVEDGDICRINPIFISYVAGALLHAPRIRRAGEDPDEHRTQYGVNWSIAEDIGGKAPQYKNLMPNLLSIPDIKVVET
ncbi:MAG: hypothetical protein KKD77_24190, partial [Gammaproteobacteria bacterium]|nr:hypothetical protein [Gammaproteobacteria bacterium]